MRSYSLLSISSRSNYLYEKLLSEVKETVTDGGYSTAATQVCKTNRPFAGLGHVVQRDKRIRHWQLYETEKNF
jgi:hypothetical protein